MVVPPSDAYDYLEDFAGIVNYEIEGEKEEGKGAADDITVTELRSKVKRLEEEIRELKERNHLPLPFDISKLRESFVDLKKKEKDEDATYTFPNDKFYRIMMTLECDCSPYERLIKMALCSFKTKRGEYEQGGK